MWLESAQELQDLKDAEAHDDAEARDAVVRLLGSQKAPFCSRAFVHSQTRPSSGKPGAGSPELCLGSGGTCSWADLHLRMEPSAQAAGAGPLGLYFGYPFPGFVPLQQRLGWGAGTGLSLRLVFGFEALLGSVLRTQQPWRLWRCLGSLGTHSSCQQLEIPFVAFVQGQVFIVSWSASG